MSIRSALIRRTVQGVLAISAALARRPRLAVLSHAAMTGLARLTVRFKGIRRAEDLESLGRQWQRGFPSARQVPIVEVNEDTVIAEIHTPCPLRDSGDLAACHRMMQFDREVVRHAGGQFVVLRSQASGLSHCTVALRRAGAAMDDLVPAHRVKS